MDDDEKEEGVESESVFDDDSSMSSEHVESSEGGQSEEQEQSEERTDAEESQETGTGEEQETGDKEASEEETSEEEGSDTTDKGGKKEDGERTSKGTKKDPDPQSALNQELANTRTLNQKMISLLEDPEALEEYLTSLKKEKGGGAAKVTEEADFNLDEEVKKLDTVEDLRNFAKKFVGKVNKDLDAHKARIEKGEQKQQFIARVEKIGGQIKTDIQAVKQARPELREFNADGTKNPNFNPVLDKLIGDTFEALEFDKKSGLFKGQIPFSYVAKIILDAWDNGSLAGSKRGQTIVLDKRRGRIISGPSKRGGVADESKMTAEQAIASRMKNAFAKVRARR